MSAEILLRLMNYIGVGGGFKRECTAFALVDSALLDGVNGLG